MILGMLNEDCRVCVRFCAEEVHHALRLCQKSAILPPLRTPTRTSQMYCRTRLSRGASERRPGDGHDRESPSRKRREVR